MSTTTLSSPPAVLLCNSCNTIISDTQELRGEAAELGAFIVNGVENVTVDSVQQQVHLPSGDTRTYISVLCGTCGTAVGRCYEAMEEGLQHLQSRFLLDAASIRRWQLGSCKQRAPAEVGAANVEAAPLVQQQQQRIEQLEDELLKVQHLMCFHSQRLDALDARWAADERLPGAAPDNGLQ